MENIKEKIEKLEKAIASPATPENIKEAMKDALGKLKAQNKEVAVKKDIKKETGNKSYSLPKNVFDFLPKSQIEVLKSYLKGEEKTAIQELINGLSKTISETPVTYESVGEGVEKTAYIHYFSGLSDWYIVEKDMEEEQLQSFGYVVLNGDYEMAEFGYIDISNLITLSGVEIDLYFTPKKIEDVIAINYQKESNEQEKTVENTQENIVIDIDNLTPEQLQEFRDLRDFCNMVLGE